jgi:hypothetical protein
LVIAHWERLEERIASCGLLYQPFFYAFLPGTISVLDALEEVLGKKVEFDIIYFNCNF